MSLKTPHWKVLRHYPSPLQQYCKYGKNLENLIGWILPSWSEFCCTVSLAYMNAPALEHILAQRSRLLAVAILQSLEQDFSPLIQQNLQNCITILKRNDWYSLPPDAGIQDCLVSLIFCGVHLQSCIYWRRTHNCYSLDLRTYLQFGDSIFPPSLQVTANVAASLVATSSPQSPVESLGNGLLCDHSQADLLSTRSEWYCFFPRRVFLHKPYK